MGVDVNLYAVGTVTDEELAAAEEYVAERFGRVDQIFEAWLSRSAYESDRIEFGTMYRYYGPGYERGHWPEIYGFIRALRAALPGCAVHYGGDGDGDSPEATDEYLAEIWHHWLGPNGQDYRREMRAWNDKWHATA